MSNMKTGPALILALGLTVGAGVLGWLLADGAVAVKDRERVVSVKGLAEREVPADVVIWPIQFTAADNDLTRLYDTVRDGNVRVREFLEGFGISADDISIGTPAVTDKSAQMYGGGPAPEFRYTATQTVTVYSLDVPRVRTAMQKAADLGRSGLVLGGGGWDTQVEYLFTGLNEIKPAMVEEATTMAREVAQKFAEDSASRLGKIKNASQGQFSIVDRDRFNPHIKKVRVVSTVEYYLSD
ncbi:MAG TPA: SIMPL domain-containing protein [Candidatus Krumholzibacteria bacterium]|nr:SIMPL domain-containing protein [Candidatus Krumholzibacteria bacterium]HRX51800.1 SIMPL domain-containing protein [Candidatus Krumholzibacteria bacterium]